MSSSILINITRPPTADCEALEYALAMAAFDIDVKILFSGRGIDWLNAGQASRKPGGKSPTKLLAALPMYGIDNIAVVGGPALSDENPKTFDACQTISQQEAANWARGAHHVVSF